jgi:serine/threonine protein kinase/tetratricopeptide (TPR) repeat protein
VSSPGEDRPTSPPYQAAPESTAAAAARNLQIFSAGQLISGRYRIVRCLGRGGMGEVYEAHDLELGERLALKTLLPELSLSEGALARFKTEIQLARRVTHPNVCRIFDIGRHSVTPGQEVAFLTMELLEGETLGQRLRRAGPMAVTEALPLVTQICEGLDAAHRALVIHRDFKSSNVMLVPASSGIRAVITDFGLAHSTGGVESDATITATGRVAGTPEYMAPEQLLGGETTAATDIYAFGVVMYEMLTGTRPFAGPDRTESARQRLGQKAPSPRTLVPDLDPRWELAVLRCLARNPAERFLSALDISRVVTAPEESELTTTESFSFNKRKPARRRAIIVAILILIAAAVTGALVMKPVARLFSRVPAEKHIAVLPFTNIGADASNQIFCDGVADTLAGKLSQLERFHKSFWVVPTTELRGVLTPADARRVLRVNLVVTGSIQRMGGGVRLVTNLIDAISGKQLDSRIIDAGPSELATLEDRVWERVAGMLELQLPPDVRRAISAGGTTVPGAYEFYEQGVGYLGRPGVENVDRAIALFQQALQKDQRYTLAYAGLGQAFSKKYELTKDPQWIAPARTNGLQAARLDDTLAPVHLALGQIYFSTGRAADAVHEFRRTEEIDPASAEAWFGLGLVYSEQGDLERARESFQKAVSVRPDYWIGYNGLGWFYYHHGRYADAEPQFRAVINLAPDNHGGYENLGGVYLQMGRYDDAVSILKRSIALKATPIAYSNLATAYMFLKRYAEAVPMMQAAVKLAPKDHRLWGNLGDAYSLASGFAGQAPAAYRRALELADAQLELKPNYAPTLSTAALYSAKLSDNANARARITKARQVAPDDRDVVFTSALVYALTGDRKRSLEALQTAWKHGYALEEIDKAPELAKLRNDAAYAAWRRGIGPTNP